MSIYVHNINIGGASDLPTALCAWFQAVDFMNRLYVYAMQGTMPEITVASTT